MKMISVTTSTKEQYWHPAAMLTPSTFASEDANFILGQDRYQSVDGFGGCFNELGWAALSRLPEDVRSQTIRDWFDPSGECRFTVCRLPIGASDYALEWYSCNETDGDYEMKTFSIERDKQYLIPYIKEALKYNPSLKLFASPWSPPTWMKFPKAYNYGTIRWEPNVLRAYALYFAAFVEAYAAEGIEIHQVHVQNEPAADQKFPSCVWTGEQLRVFIRDYLGPIFAERGIRAEIWLGTLNGPDPWQTKDTDYDVYANTVLSDPEARKYIAGVGYQWAGKHALQRTVESYPQLRYMQTENECGDGQNTWEYAQYVFRLFKHYFSNGVNSYIYWNMVLEDGGKSTWGWAQNSLITVDPLTSTRVVQPEYYIMRHFSHFIQRGAVRLGSAGQWSGNALAFENPDGSRVVVVANPFPETRDLLLHDGKDGYSIPLQPSSMNTILLTK